ncbi:MAG: LysR family transcriptional regulator [Anaerolineae bacterium]|nr:LysR family transcriptional regulator [Anaerolineae bacterium]
MELGQIEAFERAAREGSFTQAAEALNITQPSISARIAALERELGGALFERTGRGIRLTALGRRFLPHAERVLAAVAEGQAAVRDHLAGGLGEVQIAALNMFAMYLLPGPMVRFRRERPAVDLVLRVRLHAEIFELLYSGEATLGLIAGRPWSKDFRALAHFRDTVRAVTAAEHPLAQRQAAGDVLCIEDTFAYTVFRVRLSHAVTALSESIAEQARRGSGGAMIDLPAVMAERLLLHGHGLALLPENFVREHVAAGRLVYLDLDDMPPLTDEPVLIALADRDLDAPNAEFVRMMRAQWRHILVD